MPSNYDPTYGLIVPSGATGVLVNSNKTLVPGTSFERLCSPPWSGMATAWQQIRCPRRLRLVLRYDLRQPPDRQPAKPAALFRSGIWTGAAEPGQRPHAPWQAGVGPLAWTPRYMYPGAFDSNGAVCPATSSARPVWDTRRTHRDWPSPAARAAVQSRFAVRVPAHGWVADVGYVGTHGTHLYDWSRKRQRGPSRCGCSE